VTDEETLVVPTETAVGPDELLLTKINVKTILQQIDNPCIRKNLAGKRALRDTLDGILVFLRQCFMALLPPGSNASGLTLSDMADVAQVELLDVDKTDLYQFLMERLRINRNTLDIRMNRLREYLADVCNADM